MPRKQKRCDFFDHCALRTVYEIRGEENLVKKYCRGDFRKCGKYRLESLGFDGSLGMPRKPKKIKKGGR